MNNNIWYFGGYKSTMQDVANWGHSLESKVEHCKVFGFSYPENATAGNPLEEWNKSTQVSEQIAQQINEAGEDTRTLIVGHSSGCAIANDVAEHVLKLCSEGFQLIALDGFCPNEKLLALPNTWVWGAQCAGVYSLNYHNLKERAGDNFRTYVAHVRTRWPLHFSLVNLNVSDDYQGIDYGYHRCDANAEVLGL